MGKYGGMKDAQKNAGGVYFLAGTFLVEVDEVFDKESRKKKDLFIVSATILESNNDDRKPGTKASWVVNLEHDAALGNIKDFVIEASGLSSDDVADMSDDDFEETMDYVTGDDNPLQGTKMRLVCTNVKTRAGGDFTVHDWSRVD